MSRDTVPRSQIFTGEKVSSEHTSRQPTVVKDSERNPRGSITDSDLRRERLTAGTPLAATGWAQPAIAGDISPCRLPRCGLGQRASKSFATPPPRPRAVSAELTHAGATHAAPRPEPVEDRLRFASALRRPTRLILETRSSFAPRRARNHFRSWPGAAFKPGYGAASALSSGSDQFEDAGVAALVAASRPSLLPVDGHSRRCLSVRAALMVCITKADRNGAQASRVPAEARVSAGYRRQGDEAHPANIRHADLRRRRAAINLGELLVRFYVRERAIDEGLGIFTGEKAATHL